MTFREYYMLLLEELITIRLNIFTRSEALAPISDIATHKEVNYISGLYNQIGTLEELCQNLREQIRSGAVNWQDEVITLDELLATNS